MKKKLVTGLVIGLFVGGVPAISHAVTLAYDGGVEGNVIAINGLVVDGTTYNAAFHGGTSPGGWQSFFTLWGDLGTSSTGMLGGTPTFWNNRDGAMTAAQAIADALGTTEHTDVNGSNINDSFFLPYSGVSASLNTQSSINVIMDVGGARLGDPLDSYLTLDILEATVANISQLYAERPVVSFDVVPTSPVPVPAAVWLFGSGLIGLIGIARRKKS